MVVEKLNRRKSQDTEQIPAEPIAAGVQQFALRSINFLILFGIRGNCLRSGRSRSLYLSIKHIVVIIEAYHAYKILCNILLSRLTPCAGESIGDHQCGFRRNRLTILHILRVRQTLEEKWA